MEMARGLSRRRRWRIGIRRDEDSVGLWTEHVLEDVLRTCFAGVAETTYVQADSWRKEKQKRRKRRGIVRERTREGRGT